MLVAPPGTTAFSSDATVHAVTLGFILSMIFGHAPITLPAMTGLRITYGGLLYGPLALLHISVALRASPISSNGVTCAQQAACSRSLR